MNFYRGTMPLSPMTSADEPKFSSMMARLKQGYVQSLASKAEELCEAMAQYGEGLAAGAESEVGSLVHRLAGTAGSFGVDDVSERAAHIEKRMHAGMTDAELAGEIAGLAELMHKHARGG
jgi:HPt (histidine-containing phosphotransfer) domain-containing protein